LATGLSARRAITFLEKQIKLHEMLKEVHGGTALEGKLGTPLLGQAIKL
jgi:hypothetical protein